MNNLHKRYLLFLVGCLGSRLLLVYLAKHASSLWLSYMGYLACLPALGFLYLFFTNQRHTGPEVFGEKIWWMPLRLIHGMLYAAFAAAAITHRQAMAWKLLLLDVALGFTSFVVYHFVLSNN